MHKGLYTPARIKLNCSILNLPHIRIPELNAIFMIDTGSQRSFLNPKLANQYFCDFKHNENFEVVSTHASSKHNEVVYIPLPRTFRSYEL